MSLATNLQSLVTRIATEFKTAYGRIGTLSSLTTIEKTNLVGAVNEVAAAIASGGGAAINDTTASTTSVYSSSKTDSQISAATAALVASAPGTLDTLNELAAALGDDANYAATMTTALGGKAALVHTHVSTDITDATTVGKAVLTAASASAARTTLGAGTSSLVIGTASGTAADAALVGDTTTDFVAGFESGLV